MNPILLYGGQLQDKIGYEKSPLMVTGEIIGSCVVYKNLKWNFIVIFYKLFVKGHYNLFLNRDAKNKFGYGYSHIAGADR